MYFYEGCMSNFFQLKFVNLPVNVMYILHACTHPDYIQQLDPFTLRKNIYNVLTQIQPIHWHEVNPKSFTDLPCLRHIHNARYWVGYGANAGRHAYIARCDNHTSQAARISCRRRRRECSGKPPVLRTPVHGSHRASAEHQADVHSRLWRWRWIRCGGGFHSSLFSRASHEITNASLG